MPKKKTPARLSKAHKLVLDKAADRLSFAHAEVRRAERRTDELILELGDAKSKIRVLELQTRVLFRALADLQGECSAESGYPNGDLTPMGLVHGCVGLTSPAV